MDLTLTYEPQIGAMDIALDGADLRAEQSLATALLLSLMCDCLAQPHKVHAGAERRGWWADTYAKPGDDRFG